MRATTLSFSFAAALLSSVYAKEAPVCLSNPPGAQYVATLPDTANSTIRGSVQISSAPDGTGASVQVSISGLATEYGPYPYHIHVNQVSDGNCTSTGAHLDPYLATETPPCDPTRPQICQVGDLAGKHGKMDKTAFSANYVDRYLSLTPGSAAFVGNRSIVVHLSNGTRAACANFVMNGSGSSSAGSSSSGPSSAGSNSGGTSGAYGSGSGSGSGAGSDSASSPCASSASIASVLSAVSTPAMSAQGSVVGPDNSAATAIVPIGTGSGQYGGDVAPPAPSLTEVIGGPQTPASDLSAYDSSEPTDTGSGEGCSTVTILTTVSTENSGSIYTISGAIIQSTSSVPTMAAFTIVDNDETYTSLSTGMVAQTVTFTSEFDIVSTAMVPVVTTIDSETTGVNVENVPVTQTLTLTSEGETITITTVSSEGVAQALSDSILGDQTIYTTDSDGNTMTVTSDYAANTIVDADGATITQADGATITNADGATITQDDSGNTILETPATPPSDQTITEADANPTIDGTTQTVEVQTDNAAATMAAGAGAGIGALALAAMLL